MTRTLSRALSSVLVERHPLTNEITSMTRHGYKALEQQSPQEQCVTTVCDVAEKFGFTVMGNLSAHLGAYALVDEDKKLVAQIEVGINRTYISLSGIKNERVSEILTSVFQALGY